MSDIALKQPPVLKLAFLSAMCERFGFYTLSYLVVLYAKGELGYSDTEAFTLFAVFSALSYLTPAIGGYLADNFFGIRRSAIGGLLFEATGLCLLSIPNKILFSLSLAMIIIGVGLFKTSTTHLMGRSYKDKDPRIDSGFTLYYMGINIGSLATALLTGFVQKHFGWHVAFLAGGIGIFCGLVFYFVFRKSAVSLDSECGSKPLPPTHWIMMIAGLAASCVAFAFLVSHAKIEQIVLILGTAGILSYFVYEIIRSPRDEKLRIIACLSLIIIGFIFYILYFQAYTSIVLFINRSVSRVVLGFEIPTVVYFGLNNIWVIILGPILAALYNSLGKNNRDLAVTTKFALGVFVTSLCFFSLVLGSYFPNTVGQVSSWWMVLAYFLYTLGEMLVGALGVAMITRIAPKRMYGVMQGTWFLIGVSLAAALSGVFATIANVPDAVHDPFMILSIYKMAFLKIGIASMICAGVTFAVSPYIKKIAQI